MHIRRDGAVLLGQHVSGLVFRAFLAVITAP